MQILYYYKGRRILKINSLCGGNKFHPLLLLETHSARIALCLRARSLSRATRTGGELFMPNTDNRS